MHEKYRQGVSILHGGTYTWGLCIGIMSGLLWGINNFLFARGYEQLPSSQIASGLDAFSLAIIVPVVCATINDICAAAALLVFNGIRGVLSVVRSHLFTKAGFFVCLAALLGGPVGQSAYFLGIAFAGPSAALIITATYPIIGCILSYFFLHQRITGRMWFGIVISVVGAIFVGYMPEEGAYTFFLSGLLCACLAAFCWGSEVVLSYYGMTDMDPDVAITLRECISGGVLMFAIVITGSLSMLREIIKIPSGISLLSGAGIIAGFSYLMWYAANKRIGCARGMAANSTYVIWGVLLNALVVGWESVSAQTIAGCVCVLTGVILVSLTSGEVEDV